MKRILTKIPILLFFIIVLLGLLNCASAKPYKLSEALPNYAKYEGKSIDPLIDTPVNKPETGVQKYDAFFVKAKSLIIKIHFAKKLANAKNTSDVPDKAALFMDIASDLPSLAIEIKTITEEGNNLVSSAKADFMGPDILKLPSVLGELAVTSKELAQAGVAIPELIVAFSSKSSDDQLAETENKIDSSENIGEISSLASQLNNASESPNESKPLITSKSNKPPDKSESELSLNSNFRIPDFSDSEATKTRLFKKKSILINFQNYLNKKKDM